MNENAVTEPETSTEPLNSDCIEPDWFSTLKNPSGDTEAVTEPLKIRDESIAKFAMLMLVIPLPSPLMIPLTTFKLPLISTEPVNSEPICEPVAAVIT